LFLLKKMWFWPGSGSGIRTRIENKFKDPDWEKIPGPKSVKNKSGFTTLFKSWCVWIPCTAWIDCAWIPWVTRIDYHRIDLNPCPPRITGKCSLFCTGTSRYGANVVPTMPILHAGCYVVPFFDHRFYRAVRYPTYHTVSFQLASWIPIRIRIRLRIQRTKFTRIRYTGQLACVCRAVIAVLAELAGKRTRRVSEEHSETGESSAFFLIFMTSVR